MKMFPNKRWTLGGLKTLTKKLTVVAPWNVAMDDNIDDVGDLVLSQESAPQTHSSQCQIARHVGIAISPVNRIIHKDLELKCLKKRRARVNGCQSDFTSHAFSSVAEALSGQHGQLHMVL